MRRRTAPRALGHQPTRALPRLRATVPQVDAAGRLLDVASLIKEPGKRSVVILAHPSQREAVLPWLTEFAGDRVRVLSENDTPEWHLDARSAKFRRARTFGQVSLELKKLDSVDIIVSLFTADLLPGEAHDQYQMFQRVFRFLNPGGAFILDRKTAPVPSSELGLTRWIDLLAAAEDPARLQTMRRRDAELARSAGTVIMSRDLIVVTKRFRHFLKLREGDLARVLPPREPDLTVTELDKRQGQELVSRAQVQSHGHREAPRGMPREFRVPALTLRRYDGQIGSPGGQLLFTGRSILPDSFRWYMTDNPTNIRLTSVSPDFARIESRFIPRRTLPGHYYSLDSSHSGHFGHLTTEVLSRLWGWDRAKREIPELKAFFHLKPESRRDPRLELEFLAAYGIPQEDVVYVNEPVWLESVVAATPMWHNESPHYAHPEMQDIWARLTAGLLSREHDIPAHDRIFVSRTLSNRRCRNRLEVEQFFVANGFHVVFPEKLSLPEQAFLFSEAKVVAGFAGSAMFNLMHAQKLHTTIVLSHDAYTARNEHLFTSIIGGDAHYFWSPADIAQPDGEFSRKAFFSGWDFDFENNRAPLSAVIEGLP